MDKDTLSDYKKVSQEKQEIGKILTPIRLTILEACKDIPRTMAELQKAFSPMSRGALKHHLLVLEKNKLIYPLVRNEQEIGRPTYIRTDLTRVNDIEKREKELRQKIEKKFVNENTKLLLDLLMLANSKASMDLITDHLNSFTKNPFQTQMLIQEAESFGFIEQALHITEEGEKFLKKNSK